MRRREDRVGVLGPGRIGNLQLFQAFRVGPASRSGQLDEITCMRSRSWQIIGIVLTPLRCGLYTQDEVRSLPSWLLDVVAAQRTVGP